MPCANRARVVLRLSIYTGSRMARWLNTGTSFNRSRRRRPMATACSDQMAAHSQPDNLSVLAIADEVIEEAAICCCWQEGSGFPYGLSHKIPPEGETQMAQRPTLRLRQF